MNLASRIVAVGLPERGRYFFQIAPDRLQGAHLQLYWGALTPASNDALLDLDLGIDAARARALLRNAPAVEPVRP